MRRIISVNKNSIKIECIDKGNKCSCNIEISDKNIILKVINSENNSTINLNGDTLDLHADEVLFEAEKIDFNIDDDIFIKNNDLIFKLNNDNFILNNKDILFNASNALDVITSKIEIS